MNPGPVGGPRGGAKSEYTIDGLARAGETTVRSIRVYHERGVLPSPEIRGRIGYYGPDHLSRLRTITRLLNRGMKLNGIKELFDAWDHGQGLADVLGVEAHRTASDLESAGAAGDLADRVVDAGRLREAVERHLGRVEFECDRIAGVIHELVRDKLSELGDDPETVAELRMLCCEVAADLVARALRHRLVQREGGPDRPGAPEG